MRKNKDTDGSFWRFFLNHKSSTVGSQNHSRRSGILSSTRHEPLLHLLSFGKPLNLANPSWEAAHSTPSHAENCHQIRLRSRLTSKKKERNNRVQLSEFAAQLSLCGTLVNYCMGIPLGETSQSLVQACGMSKVQLPGRVTHNWPATTLHYW